MKRRLLLFFAGVLGSALCAGFVACNEPEGPELQGVDVPFTEYSFTGGPGEEVLARWVNLDYDESTFKAKILVIDSDEELKKYVEGDYPAVDFSRKTLILAYGWDSGISFGHDKFQRVSDRNYVMTVSGLAYTMALEVYWQAAIVVDKLPSDSTIKLNKVILNRS